MFATRVVVSLAAVALVAAPAAVADSPVVPLASQIASHIAGRPVTVRCPDAATFAAAARGGDALGMVGAWVYPDGTFRPGDYAEIAPQVCDALNAFANAHPKPTLCAPQTTEAVYALKPFKVKKRVKVKGKWKTITKTVKRKVPVGSRTHPAGPPGPCYSSAKGKSYTTSPTFWPSYFDYAQAILVLAHESIHLGGAMARVSNGKIVGDPLAEAHANCYGLQWMPWVATQLGDSPEDALAIAEYAWDVIYPQDQGTPYWSADCAPNGAMDVRADKNSAWP